MKLFLKANALWEIVENCFQQKDEAVQYTEAQLQKLKEDELKDAKALSYILNAVTHTIFPKIMRALSAKSAWQSLVEEFQGDERVRTSRLNYLRKYFDSMKMKENEDTKVYTARLLEVVNQMKAHREDISDARIVQKILATLTNRYNTIATIIEESKDLSQLSVIELMSSLQLHDPKLKKPTESSSEEVSVQG